MITDRRQLQALRDLIVGQEPEITKEQLTDGDYTYIWEQLDQQPKQDRYETMMRLRQINDEAEFRQLIDDILTLTPGDRLHHRHLLEIGPELPNVEWLWPGWIPRGLLSLMAAWPGIGKTYVALEMARRLIAGQPAPDGQAFINDGPGRVVYVDAEDFLPVVYSRAQAWGMDMSQFYPIRRPPRDLIDMSSKFYQDQLVDMCFDLQPALVIVDSLSSVNLKGENSIEDLREVLGFFIELPKMFNCGLVLIHHLRKPNQGRQNGSTNMHDLRGSGHLVAMARSIIGMDTVTDDPNGPRWLKVIKTNLCKYPKPISVRFSQNPHNIEVADLNFNRDYVQLPDNLSGKCAEFILKTLEKEPKKYTEIKVLALAQNPPFNETMLQEARRVLGTRVIDTLGTKKRGNQWVLAPDTK